MEPHDPHQEHTLQALLRDSGWIRRLAAGLVGRDQVEDLTQEVLVAALKGPGPREAAGIRAWVRTVAARLAAHGRDRQDLQSWSDRQGARPEAVELQPDERLHWHRQLAEAMQRLPEPYRVALVLRYFDELNGPEIARRLGISEANARQRIARGLALLRADLDRTGGGREIWFGSLVGFLPGGPGDILPWPVTRGPVSGVPTPSPSGLAPIAKVGAVLALTGAALVAVPLLRDGPSAHPDPARRPLAPLAQETGPQFEAAADPAGTAAAPISRQSAAAPVSAGPTGPVLRLLDAAGRAPAHGRASYVTQAGEYHVLSVDARGRAFLPPGLADVTLLGSGDATSAPITLWNSGPLAPETILELPDRLDLSGTLYVDGQPGPAGVAIELKSQQEHLDAVLQTGAGQPVRARIQMDGFVEAVHWSTTDANGRFHFEGLHPGNADRLRLPDSFRTDVGLIPAGTTRLELESTRLPYVRARFLWEDSREPYPHPISWNRLEAHSGTMGWKIMTPAPDGTVELGIPLRSPENPALGLLYGQAVLQANPPMGVMQEFARALTPEQLPLDWGDLLVHRPAPGRAFEVVDETGMPVSGGVVAWPGKSAHLDTDGRVQIPGGLKGPIWFAGPGLGVQILTGEQLPEPGGPARKVTLSPAASLTVTSPVEPQRYQSSTPAILRTSYTGPVLAGWFGIEEGAFEGDWPNAALMQQLARIRIQRFLLDGGREVQIEWRQAAMVLSPLPPGGAVEVALTDWLDSVLARQIVEIPQDPAQLALTLAPPPATYGFVQLDGLDERGESVGSCQVRLALPETPPRTARMSLPCTLGPLAVGKYMLTMQADRRREVVREIEVVPGNQVLTLAMDASHPLRCEWPSDQAAPEALTVTCADGTQVDVTSWKDGCATFEGLPGEPCQLHVQFGLHALVLPVHAAQTEITLPSRVSGAVQVQWKRRPRAQLTEKNHLLLIF
ncbi:MAG: sigma-70 family RNA polymerase sigma factor, partial [Planctomycetota bacterium]